MEIQGKTFIGYLSTCTVIQNVAPVISSRKLSFLSFRIYSIACPSQYLDVISKLYFCTSPTLKLKIWRSRLNEKLSCKFPLSSCMCACVSQVRSYGVSRQDYLSQTNCRSSIRYRRNREEQQIANFSETAGLVPGLITRIWASSLLCRSSSTSSLMNATPPGVLVRGDDVVTAFSKLLGEHLFCPDITICSAPALIAECGK